MLLTRTANATSLLVGLRAGLPADGEDDLAGRSLTLGETRRRGNCPSFVHVDVIAEAKDDSRRQDGSQAHDMHALLGRLRHRRVC